MLNVAVYGGAEVVDYCLGQKMFYYRRTDEGSITAHFMYTKTFYFWLCELIVEIQSTKWCNGQRRVCQLTMNHR